MSLGQWALLQSGQPQQVHVPSGNYMWPTIRVMNPNDGTLYIKQNGPLVDTGYGSWDYKCPAQSFGILPSEGQGWSSAGLYYLDQSGTNRPGEVAVYLSNQTVNEPTFVAIGRSLVSSSTSVDIVSGAQPANPGAGFGRLWIDTGGHLNILQPSGSNYLVLDSTTQFGGDIAGTVNALSVQVRYGSQLRMYTQGGILHVFAGVNGANTYIYQVDTGPIQFLTTANANLAQLDSQGNFLATGIIGAGSIAGSLAGDISAVRTSSPSTGVIYLGNTNHYLFFDGTYYNLPSGILLSSGIANTGNITATGYFVAGSQTTTGTYYFGNTGTKYLTFDGQNLSFIGGGIASTGPLLLNNDGTTQIVGGGSILYLRADNYATFQNAAGNANIQIYVGQINGQAGATFQQGTTAPYVGASGYFYGPTIYLGGNGVAPYIQLAGAGGSGPTRYVAQFHSMEAIGGGYAAVNASAFTVGSAKRFKDNIITLKDPLAIIMNPTLHGISYTDITHDEPVARIGFVADDWDPVLPEVVWHNPDGEIEGMLYSDLAAVLFEGMKEYITQTNARLSKLEQSIAT